jgi:hypothetical protein
MAFTDESPAQAAKGDMDGAHRPADSGHAGAGHEPAGAAGTKRGGLRDHTGPIIVVVSTIGVVIAWLTFKSQKNQAAATTATTIGTPATGAGAGLVVGSATPDPNASLGLQTSLDNLSAMLQGIAGGGAGPSAGTGLPTSPSNVPVYERFVDYGNGLGVYSVENGSAKLLSLKQWIGLGKPAFDTVTTQNSDFALVQAAAARPSSTAAPGLPPSTAPTPGVNGAGAGIHPIPQPAQPVGRLPNRQAPHP